MAAQARQAAAQAVRSAAAQGPRQPAHRLLGRRLAAPQEQRAQAKRVLRTAVALQEALPVVAGQRAARQAPRARPAAPAPAIRT